ncbi:MAG: hypothetical protein PHU59_03120 [Candidatus Omnitrophica bacterium]|jgi:DNA polymerase III delta subunit|nr:hypothetical protein [Candidatus Omnitrophota bacterium]
MVYLLIGADPQAKEIQLNKIKQEFLPQELRDFNLDILYSKEINLKAIQEKFLSLPLKSAKRIIIIKDAQSLDEQSRDFLLNYSLQPLPALVLVLDFEHYDYKDEFIKKMSAQAKVIRFQQAINPDSFALSRQIELKKADLALRMLNQLLSNGEPAEKVLGGLRYAWERQNIQTLEAKKKLKLLLACDIEIKTGRLKPAFALEKLVVNLCGLV